MNETTAKQSAPLLGAAMPIRSIAAHRDWLLEEGGRDLEIQDSFHARALDSDWAPLVAQARTALDGYAGRLGIHGPYDGLSIASTDPAVQQFVAGRYLRALEFAAALGATHMVIHSPFLFFGHPQVAHSPENGLAQELEAAHQTLARVLAVASGLGLTLVIENICDTNPAPLLELVRSFDSPWVRLGLDVGHVHLMQRIGGPTPDAWVRQAGSLLGHLHLQDNDGTYDYHWNPGQGGVNWWALFAALAETAGTPRLILETKGSVLPAAHWLARQGFAR
jgi:sugar phosphate isomerase/epimerase